MGERRSTDATRSSEVGPAARRLRNALCRRVAAGADPGLPTVEGYRLVGLAASGGMGMVYAAVSEASGRKVALKVVRREQHGLTASERVLREVRALSAVTHPGIVGYVDHGVT